MEANTRILSSIQVLRALAAMLVLLHHAQLGISLGFGMPDALPDMAVGSAGVDLFFVISGFIMVVSSWDMFGKGRTGTFLARRSIRLVPLYWAATLVYLLAARLMPATADAHYPAEIVWAAFLFWPTLTPGGALAPVHPAGWTLNYEMFFYALFGLALLMPRRWAIPGLAAVLAAIVAAGSVFAPSAIPLIFWSNPIILEFALGMGLGLAYGAGWRLDRPIAWLLGLVAIATLAAHAGSILQGYERLLFWGVPAAFLVAGAALSRTHGVGAPARPLVWLGDASYALYLVHLPTLWALRVAAGKLGLQPTTTSGAWLYVACAVLACVTAALVVHRYFERPVTSWLKAALARASQQRAGVNASKGSVGDARIA